MRLVTLFLVATLLACTPEARVAGNPGCPIGAAGCPCDSDGLCAGTLACVADICVALDDGDPAGGDAGPGDLGPGDLAPGDRGGDTATGDPGPGDNGAGDPMVTGQGVGDPCNQTANCRVPLICDTDDTCQASGTVADGDPCGLTADCAPGLFCDMGLCAPAGSTPEGDPCRNSTDCEVGLFCAFEGIGGTCREGGSGDIGDACTVRADCMANLVCVADSGTCEVTLPAPAGDACISHGQCDAANGLYCLPSGVCGGVGPDQLPIPPWSGATCPASESGTFRVLFEVDNTSEDFFRLPFPNDIRITGGTVDLTGFPTPSSASVPTDMVSGLISAIEASQDGFGPNQSVFLRLSHRPLFCAAGCASAGNCAAGCMGGGEPGQSIYAVNLTDGRFVPHRWRASTSDRRYLCGPWIAVAPGFSAPWEPGKTYAVFLHGRILGSGGETQNQDADFAAMLGSTQPADVSLQAAWSTYQPLRDWLATSPVYPAGDLDAGATILGSHLGGAAVFTVRDPTTLMTALGDVVEAASAPAISSLLDCTDPGVDVACHAPAAATFFEVQGTVELPIFQGGTAPYLTTGGDIVTDAGGVPQEQRREAVRFSLTVPRLSAQPAGGWPVVVYAHGTSGDYQMHLQDNVAAVVATATTPAVVIGIDQVAHGTRRGGSTTTPELLFFNIGNPTAARGNVLQSAADQLSLFEAVEAIETAVASLAGQGSFALDSTRVAFLGHSQGATAGVPAMARASTTGAFVVSGAGGGLLTTLEEKTSPYDVPTVMSLLLADTNVSPTWAHPVLALLQGYMEDADPVNYGRHVSVVPLAGSQSKHLLHVVGVGDTYTPNTASQNLARRMTPQFGVAGFSLKGGAGIYLDDDASGLGTPLATAPVQGNYDDGGSDRTMVVTIHAPASRDGHFVLFTVAKARERVAEFLSDYMADPSTAPAVVP